MESLQRLLRFGAGTALGIILALSYDFERFIPVGVAFGLLCFISGMLLMQFVALRKQEQKSLEEQVGYLAEMAKFNKEREDWRAEKEEEETETGA